jgi:sec-independent protein translocase protein TatA
LLVIVILLLFGAKRLPGLARSVGQSLKIFKSEVKDLTDDGDDAKSDAAPAAATAPSAPPAPSTASAPSTTTPSGLINPHEPKV